MLATVGDTLKYKCPGRSPRPHAQPQGSSGGEQVRVGGVAERTIVNVCEVGHPTGGEKKCKTLQMQNTTAPGIPGGSLNLVLTRPNGA